MELTPVDQDALRAIVFRHVPKDSDETYTRYFEKNWYEAVSRARRVIVTGARDGRIHLSWVDADGEKLLDLDGHSDRLFSFAVEWADWLCGHAGYSDCLDDRREGST